ncbi:MAG: hypothetical protein ACOH1V_07195 [Stenotrophomonas sp.]
MSSSPSLRPALFIGLLLLACWAGWIVATFGMLGTRVAGDAALAAFQHEALSADLPVALAHTPLAIRLDRTRCNCPGTDDGWPGIVAAMTALGGHAITVPAPAGGGGDFPLLVRAANGALVYAGPLQPAPALCGRNAGTLAQWLPELMSGSSAPLLLSPHCSC